MSRSTPIRENDRLACDPHQPLAEETLVSIQQQTLETEKAQRMAEFFSLLGDTNRLRLLSVLVERELCVCDLATILGMSESAVSHQLRAMRALRLVSYQKRGRKVYYRLQDRHVLELYNSVAEHLDEEGN